MVPIGFVMKGATHRPDEAPGVNATDEVLDVQHARSHIHTCWRALFGDGTPGATAWGREWSSHIYDHGPDGLLAELTRLKQQGVPASAERVLTNLLDYEVAEAEQGDPMSYGCTLVRRVQAGNAFETLQQNRLRPGDAGGWLQKRNRGNAKRPRPFRVEVLRDRVRFEAGSLPSFGRLALWPDLRGAPFETPFILADRCRRL